jgi:hypothetical protein
MKFPTRTQAVVVRPLQRRLIVGDDLPGGDACVTPGSSYLKGFFHETIDK